MDEVGEIGGPSRNRLERRGAQQEKGRKAGNGLVSIQEGWRRDNPAHETVQDTVTIEFLHALNVASRKM
jgi:hypothetical protein